MTRSSRLPLWPGEVRALVSACDSAREKLVILALIETGMTTDELTGLTAKDVNWVERTIKRTQTQTPLRVSEALIELFRQQLKPNRGLGIGNRQIQRIVRALGKRAGLSMAVTPDVLRRTSLWNPLSSPDGGNQRGAILLEAARAAIDIILVADDDRRFVDVNQAASDLLGLPREAILGRPIEEFFEEAKDQSIPAAWSAFIAANEQCGVCRLRASRTVAFEYRARANFVPGLHVSVLRPVGSVE